MHRRTTLTTLIIYFRTNFGIAQQPFDSGIILDYSTHHNINIQIILIKRPQFRIRFSQNHLSYRHKFCERNVFLKTDFKSLYTGDFINTL